MFSEPGVMPTVMPKMVDWAFEGLLGLMFIVTFLAQAAKDLDWWSWRRRTTQQQQLHGPEMVNYPCPSRSGRSGKLGDEYRRDAYSAGPRNPPKATSYIMRAILATVFVGIAAYALTYLSSKSNAVSTTLGMCPGTSNSSLANVTATWGPKGNCTCADLRLPEAIGTVE